MRFRPIILLWLLWLAGAGGAVQAETARDPFETTAGAEIPSNFEKAIQQIAVKGIVRTETAQRIIVSIAGIDGLAVLKPGDKLALDFQGRPHLFTVGDVGVKNVQFRAVPVASKGAPQDAATYEVLVR